MKFSANLYQVFQISIKKTPYSVQIRENTEQKNSEYGHFLRSDRRRKCQMDHVAFGLYDFINIDSKIIYVISLPKFLRSESAMTLFCFSLKNPN